MSRSTRALRIALLGACLTLALAAGAGAQTAVVRYQHESFGAFEKQLGAGQIHAATFNKKAHTLHLLLNNGKHMLVSYPSHVEPQLAAKLQAHGVPVTIEKKKKKTVAKAVHHTLRYIAGGIVIVVIIVVAAVLLVDRRRKLNEGGQGTPAPSSSGDSAT
jgi:hypothetical protein